MQEIAQERERYEQEARADETAMAFERIVKTVKALRDRYGDNFVTMEQNAMKAGTRKLIDDFDGLLYTIEIYDRQLQSGEQRKLRVDAYIKCKFNLDGSQELKEALNREAV